MEVSWWRRMWRVRRRIRGGRRSPGRGAIWRELRSERLVLDMEALMSKVFDAVSSVKRAYMALQDAHNPWDPDRMRVADVFLVGQLRRLGVLRERNQKSVTCQGGSGGGGGVGVGGLGGAGLGVREVVAPYEAVAEDLRRQVKAWEAEVESLKEKLRCLAGGSDGGGKKGRKLAFGAGHVAVSPSPELFKATMGQSPRNSQVFHIPRHFPHAVCALGHCPCGQVDRIRRPYKHLQEHFDHRSSHAKYALQSYACHKFFKGFNHETFYMDGSLSSLLNPKQHRRECFTQFRDMKSMDPVELLGVLPSCQFGKFCSKKYLSIVHPRMEESFFGNSEHHRQVSQGNHSRTQFYKEFLGGAEFHPEYMESVVRFFGGLVPAGHVFGFPVSPGFRLGSSNGNTKSVIMARVYLVSRS
ncbi:hypothetical protein MLD38_011550 [Melastoma candidum]|uniref:Uncharacterized protein n=1 Tax=Melastoma candidum TaxID=119954 RepID=A0ACB9R3F7_9MYRT|nr:hypothetical protein MLD38_011550 [Melastoma candidum]